DGLEARGEDAVVVASLDELDPGLAVGLHRRLPEHAAVVTLLGRRQGADGASARRGLVRGTRVLDLQRDYLHAVPVDGDVAADLVAGRQGAAEHEPDVTLLQRIRRDVATAR